MTYLFQAFLSIVICGLMGVAVGRVIEQYNNPKTDP